MNADFVHNVIFILQEHMSVQMEMHSVVTLGTTEEKRDENIQLQKCLKEFMLEDLQRWYAFFICMQVYLSMR